MADPLSISASIAGLVTLAQTLLPLLINFVDDVSAYSKDFKDLVDEIRGFCGVLYALQPVIKSFEGNSGSILATAPRGYSPSNCLTIRTCCLL